MTDAPRPARSAAAQAELDAMGQRRYELEVDAQRERFRIAVRGSVACLVWCGVGLAGIAWAMHSTDLVLAKRVFAGGVVVGNAGVLFSILRTWVALDRVDE